MAIFKIIVLNAIEQGWARYRRAVSYSPVDKGSLFSSEKNTAPGVTLCRRYKGSLVTSSSLLPWTRVILPPAVDHTCMAGPIVVKVGGSLRDQVPRLISEIRASRRPVLVVPGGGAFADLVREWEPPEEAEHWMSVAAMDQFGWFLAGFGLPVTDRLVVPDQPVVLLPYKCLREEDPLPRTADVTSDTIAAWVASRLDLDLLVIKSVAGITVGGVLAGYIDAFVPTDVVDPCFLPFCLTHGVRAGITSGRKEGEVRAILCGEARPGTTIGGII